MKFSVVQATQLPRQATSSVFLIRDPWDDSFEFDTRFRLVTFDEDGKRYVCYNVKIGQVALKSGREAKTFPPTRSPDLAFDPQGGLTEDFFSLGQGDDYYEMLNTMPPSTRVEVLVGMRDCAYNLPLFKKYREEPVLVKSLMRYITEESVQFRFHRLAHGNAILTNFHFQYLFPCQGDEAGPFIDFAVNPRSDPPTNVHVLIGRNGVGKSRCIQGLTAAVLNRKRAAKSC